jgi:hypothetical protein
MCEPSLVITRLPITPRASSSTANSVGRQIPWHDGTDATKVSCATVSLVFCYLRNCDRISFAVGFPRDHCSGSSFCQRQSPAFYGVSRACGTCCSRIFPTARCSLGSGIDGASWPASGVRTILLTGTDPRCMGRSCQYSGCHLWNRISVPVPKISSVGQYSLSGFRRVKRVGNR